MKDRDESLGGGSSELPAKEDTTALAVDPPGKSLALTTTIDACHDQQAQLIGTAWLFERKKNYYARKLAMLAFLGFVGPIFGFTGLVIVGLSSPATFWILLIAGLLGLWQGLLSLAALAYSWHNELPYCAEAQATNRGLAEEYKSLARDLVTESERGLTQFRVLEGRRRTREMADGQKITLESEKRAAYRKGLFDTRRTCGSCAKAVTTLTPTDCDACGRFPKEIFQ